MLGQATVYPILEESKSSILNIIRPGDLPLGNGVVDMLTLFCFISLNSFNSFADALACLYGQFRKFTDGRIRGSWKGFARNGLQDWGHSPLD